jgi:hypothetical protein
MSKKVFAVQTVLDLACAAHRTNMEYIREADGRYLGEVRRIPNKILMLHTLDLSIWHDQDGLPPKVLKVTDEDRAMADEIRDYFRRLTFKVIDDDSSVFDTSVNSILNNTEMSVSEVGFVAYLPTKYLIEKSRNKIEKFAKTCDSGYLGVPDHQLFDLDSEILEISRSKNYEAWNITANIDNKMCSWMTKDKLLFGPAVIVRAKIKEHSRHWKYNNPVTRLNYVKAAQ